MNDLVKDTGKLGFGLMRLPRRGDDIDVEQVKEMVDLFMEAGFTYFDTAWVYQGSEEAMRQALVERYPRSSYTVATKLAAWASGSREEAVAQFETSLQRSGLDYFDFYLLHNMGQTRTHFFDEYGIWEFAKELREKGKIRHLGFSFHANASELEEVLQAHPEVEFVQLQINYADWESPDVQSRKVYETARRLNKPIVIMEPVKGGLLADPPQAVADILKEANPGASYPSWAIRYAAGLEGVITVLSGMSSVEQMKDNISYMKAFQPLNDQEKAVLQRARAVLAGIPVIPCTTCNYCAKVCPMNIGISGTFSAMNLYTLYHNKERALRAEHFEVEDAGKRRANECIRCGKCEEACPQHIHIRENLAKAVEVL